MFAHLNGRLRRLEDALIDPADRGFTLGDGVFETMRVVSGRVPRIDAHLDRLMRGLAVIGMSLPALPDDVRRGVGELLGAMPVRDGALRLTVTRGPAPRGLVPPADIRPTVLISFHVGPPRQEAVSAVVAEETRRNEQSPLSRIKALGYLDNILALMEARRRGADEAIVLNCSGKVACASAANIFVLMDGVLATPPVADGALPGIMRDAILKARSVVERSLTRDDLARAEEICLTSALGIRTVSMMGERTIPRRDLADELRSDLFGADA